LTAVLLDLIRFRDHPEQLASRKPQVQQAAELTESLGRPWEARAWRRLLLAIEGQAASPGGEPHRHLAAAPADARTVPAANPALAVDLSSYPLPRVDGGPAPRAALAPRRTPVRFDDRALAVGIDFTYFNGQSSPRAGMPIYQVTGGGVAAMDYDLDGWPDLYFTQGSHWPPASDDAYHDRLFRNLGGDASADVTGPAGLGDERFSQGVAAGDYDNDGFPDLYVANLGRNRLYRNNGDGTFSDVTAAAGLDRGDWTTSCLIADVNGDSLPDVYDVNYVDHTQADIARLCTQDGRTYRTCPPVMFPAAQDRLYLCSGDGRFCDVTERAGIVAPDGYGLGIVAGDLDGAGRVSLFVANDQTPNFWFVNLADRPGDEPKFVDQAHPSRRPGGG
jgi:hypothetical protein